MGLRETNLGTSASRVEQRANGKFRQYINLLFLSSFYFFFPSLLLIIYCMPLLSCANSFFWSLYVMKDMIFGYGVWMPISLTLRKEKNAYIVSCRFHKLFCFLIIGWSQIVLSWIWMKWSLYDSHDLVFASPSCPRELNRFISLSICYILLNASWLNHIWVWYLSSDDTGWHI